LQGDTSVLHWTDALRTFGGDESILMRLLLKFQERAKPTMTKIRKAVKEGDMQVLKREAYSLKGSSGYIAARDLKEAAQALESAVDALRAAGEAGVGADGEEVLAPHLAPRLEHLVEGCAEQQAKVLLAIQVRTQTP